MTQISSYSALTDPTGIHALAALPPVSIIRPSADNPDTWQELDAAPFLMPEETIAVTRITHVHFYNGRDAASIRDIPGARIALPLYSVLSGGLYNDSGSAGVGCPLFDLYCTMTCTANMPEVRVFRVPHLDARFSVFYSAYELCTKAAAMANAFALQTWINGKDKSTAILSCESIEYIKLVEDLNTVLERQFATYHTNWISPAQLTAWGEILDNPLLMKMADALVVTVLVTDR